MKSISIEMNSVSTEVDFYFNRDDFHFNRVFGRFLVFFLPCDGVNLQNINMIWSTPPPYVCPPTRPPTTTTTTTNPRFRRGLSILKSSGLPPPIPQPAARKQIWFGKRTWTFTEKSVLSPDVLWRIVCFDTRDSMRIAKQVYTTIDSDIMTQVWVVILKSNSLARNK
jgi:hypothetical protein